jgi:hypothetical protein
MATGRRTATIVDHNSAANHKDATPNDKEQLEIAVKWQG